MEKKAYDLSVLFENYDGEYKSEEVDWGADVGSELIIDIELSETEMCGKELRND